MSWLRALVFPARPRPLPLLGASRPALLAAVLLISVVSSHAPSRVRYFLVIGRRSISGSRSKG